MGGLRSLSALGIMAVLAAILLVYYEGQPHPVGSLAYDYLVAFPNFLLGLAIIALVLAIVMIARRRRSR